MRIIEDAGQMRQVSRERRVIGDTIALVPTMGSLHAGHLALVEQAKTWANFVIVSIYINPTQFSKSEDFGVYPKSLAEDHLLLEKLGVDAVFQPRTLYASGSERDGSAGGEAQNVVGASELRPGDHETFVQTELLQRPLCGASRPHFFRGVATVVCKLFNITEPDIALFGSKDYQQLQVIKRMARDLDFGIRIVGMPTVREADGLAMSSRNKLLSQQDRQRATAIFQALQWAKEIVGCGDSITGAELRNQIISRIHEGGGSVDYVEVVDPDTLAPVDNPALRKPVIAMAAFYGSVRLIDNIQL